MVKDSANCWSPAKAIGHAGPHALLSALCSLRHRDDTQDGRGLEKRSPAAVGAAALGGLGLDAEP
ncbi:hypothetical protein ACFTTN_27490, partial [Streptomyces niveus]|uniref:hypothetical protein n=1 Tax=Streptomyces niveus TaxID=193462 RepID=UPI00362BB2A8